MSNNRTRAANPRTHSLRFSEYVLSVDSWKPGSVKERMPNVRARVTPTADPQSHHSRPSTWRRWTAGMVVLLPDRKSLLTAMAACSLLRQLNSGDSEKFRRIEEQEKLPKSERTDAARKFLKLSNHESP